MCKNNNNSELSKNSTFNPSSDLTYLKNLKIGIIQEFLLEIKNSMYSLPSKWRNLLRYLFWPKCGVCHKKPAYFEYYEMEDVPKKLNIVGWIYVCWDCNIKHDLNAQGCVE